MNNLDKIIKEKVEQFEVPYNEAHWSEMEARLDKIRATKIRKAIVGSLVAMVIIAISSYYILSDNSSYINSVDNFSIIDQNISQPETENTVSPVNSINKNSKVNSIRVINDPVTIDEIKKEKKTQNIVVLEKNKVQEVEHPEEIATEEIISHEKVAPEKVSINADFIVYNNKSCLGRAVSFEGYNNEIPVYYTWDFGDGTISHEARPTHKYAESKSYTVTLTLLDKKSGKEYSTKQPNVVNILPKPKASFTYSEESKDHDDNKLKYPYTTFRVRNSTENNQYTWVIDNKTYKGIEHKVLFKESGNYQVSLIATNAYLCQSKKTKKINIESGSSIYIQDAFKPNSTITDNVAFIPKALLEWPDIEFEMTIKDQSGKIVYKTSDRYEPWNGKLNNTGELLNDGFYLCTIVTYDAQKNRHYHHKKINLRR